ncbi:MAG: hypothetical protein HY920_08255 [Elusimicrobia bacterium]|nr:hypothetical protein [Elusimicrobiota bacterium]
MLMKHSVQKISTLLLVLFILAGCGANRLTYYDTLNNYVSQKKIAEANKQVEDNADKFYGEKERLLYYLDHGYLFHIGGDYPKSNLMLDEARKLAKDYFTKSITQEASTFLVSDNLRPYYGEDFERAITHVFSSLNYVFLDKSEDALVEARAVDDFLKLLQTNYGSKNTYKEDGFIRYIMGLLYENEGELNDAFISYRKALYTYRDQQKSLGTEIPQDLFNSAMDAAASLQFNSEREELRKDFSKQASSFDQSKAAKTDGEIVVIHYNGLVPHKVDNILEIAFGKAWVYVGAVKTEGAAAESVSTAGTAIRSIAADEQIIAAFPKYVPTNYTITSSIVELGDKSKPTEVVEDVGKIAVKSLADRLGRIYAKTIARAAIKYALSRAARQKIEEKSNNAVGAFLLSSTVKMAAALSEKSDKRCWQVLPDTIRMARFRVPEGNYSLKINYYNRSGGKVAGEEKTGVAVKKGKKTFILVQTNY